MARTTKVDGKSYTKKSGATFSTYIPKSGPNKGNNQYITNGWFIRKKDLMNISCVTTTKSTVKESGWMGHIACTVVNKNTGEETFFWGSMQKSTGKVVIEKLSMVVNPKAPNGGYCGTFIRSNN
ncbi:hypothetical protein [Changchengzhania lutea]|uniref:hypothetical protein n=1 Tax=Changchengzhania lutea TaxID=2049305 RepID=UPI00115CD137|nr:hypothetical protein [Changchengzhania lutea]